MSSLCPLPSLFSLSFSLSPTNLFREHCAVMYLLMNVSIVVICSVVFVLSVMFHDYMVVFVPAGLL